VPTLPPPAVSRASDGVTYRRVPYDRGHRTVRADHGDSTAPSLVQLIGSRRRLAVLLPAPD